VLIVSALTLVRASPIVRFEILLAPLLWSYYPDGHMTKKIDEIIKKFKENTIQVVS